MGISEIFEPKMSIAIVGFGQQGRECYGLIKSDIPVTTIVDTRFAGRTLSHDELVQEGLADFNGGIYGSLDEALANGNFDLAIVSVPHCDHLETTKKLLLAGKPVIKEKPFALTIEDAQELMLLSDRQGVPVFTICQRNSNPLFNRAYEMMPQIGEPYGFVYRYFMCQQKTTGWRAVGSIAKGGVMLDMGYHIVDVVSRFFGSPRHVSSMLAFAHDDMRVENLEDYSAVQACFGSRLAGTILIGRHYQSKDETFEIMGSKGVIRVEPKKSVKLIDLSGNIITEVQQELQSGDIYISQVLDFIRRVNDVSFWRDHMHKNLANVRFMGEIYRLNMLTEPSEFARAAIGAKASPVSPPSLVSKGGGALPGRVAAHSYLGMHSGLLFRDDPLLEIPMI